MDRLVAAWQSISVISGRAEGANPESRNTDRACVWIPGPALTRRPGMTGEVFIFVVAGLVPAIPLSEAMPDKRNHRDKPGDDRLR